MGALDKIKKRELLERYPNDTEPNRENISLSDITNKAIEILTDCSTIELQNNKEACSRAINNSMKLEEYVRLFRLRLRDVKNDITLSRKR